MTVFINTKNVLITNFFKTFAWPKAGYTQFQYEIHSLTVKNYFSVISQQLNIKKQQKWLNCFYYFHLIQPQCTFNLLILLWSETQSFKEKHQTDNGGLQEALFKKTSNNTSMLGSQHKNANTQ